MSGHDPIGADPTGAEPDDFPCDLYWPQGAEPTSAVGGWQGGRCPVHGDNPERCRLRAARSRQSGARLLKAVTWTLGRPRRPVIPADPALSMVRWHRRVFTPGRAAVKKQKRRP
jgi:hypothetical protein